MASIGGVDQSGADVVDTSNNAIKVNVVTGTVTSSAGGYTTVGDGRKTVTTAGTRVQFSSQACKKVTISALISNTNAVYIGGSTVVAAAGSETGTLLFPGSSFSVEVTNMNLLYMDSLTNGEGVSFIWFS